MKSFLQSLRRINAMMIKEFVQLKRDKTTFGMIVMIPLMQLLLFGYAINTDPKHLPTAVISTDHSIFTRDLIVGLKNSEYFKITHEAKSEKDAHLLLQQGVVQFVVTIPEDFGTDLIRGQSPQILIEADATDPIATGGAIGAIQGIVDHVFSRDLVTESKGKTQKPPLVDIRVHKMYNPEGFSRYNIVPGLMGIILTMTGVMMTALAITRERERGTMENLLAMPITPMEVMAGKIAPYIIIGYVQAFIIVGTAYLLFDVPILGSLMLLSTILIVFIACNLAMGFALSAGAKNQMQAMQMTMSTIMPSILLSGFMFPFRGMPEWAQWVGSVLPATYFIRIVRGILLKGNGFIEIWPHLWPMMVFMCVITLIAMKRYKRTLD